MQFDDASKAFVELAASRHNAVHSTEAADVGISLRRLQRAEQRGELRMIQSRVWAHTSLPSGPKQRLRAAALTLPGSAASHQSAAWAYGWLDNPPVDHHLWVPSVSRARLCGVSVHRGVRIDPETDVVTIDHIRRLTKPAVLCLLGATAPLRVVERCVDEFLRTEPKSWLDETIERHWTPYAKGPRALAAVLDDPRRVAGVTDSWMERVVAELVAMPGLPSVTLQHDVAVEGRHFRIDIAIPALKLGIEAHGRAFHWGPTKEDADNVRDLQLGTVGWKLIYITWSQLRDPDEFVRLFAATAQARAEQLGVTLGTVRR